MSNPGAPEALLSGDMQPDGIRTRDNLKLEIFKDRRGDSLEALKERVALTYYLGFGIGIMQTAEEVGDSIVKGGSAFIVSEDGKDIALATQYVMKIEIPDDDRGSLRWIRALYTASRVVLPLYQDRNICTWTMEVQDELYKPDYFVGRTQNPAIHLAWKGLPFTGEDRPIDMDYMGEDLRSRQFRTIGWNVARRTTRNPYYADTGLAEHVYKEGETKGFTPNLDNKRYAEVDQRMAALGLVRSTGATLYYVIERIEPDQV